MPSVRVPDAARLSHGETRAFSWPTAQGERQGFVIRYGDALRAYENRCRHWPIPLDLGDGVVFSEIVDRIRCRYHGAEYAPATGECVAGPCKGEMLEAFTLGLEGEDAVVRIP